MQSTGCLSVLKKRSGKVFLSIASSDRYRTKYVSRYLKPWIVPIFETAKIQRLFENIVAKGLKLSVTDIQKGHLMRRTFSSHQNENKMGTKKMSRLIITTGVSLMLSLLINFLYNFVGSVFVSRETEDALIACH